MAEPTNLGRPLTEDEKRQWREEVLRNRTILSTLGGVMGPMHMSAGVTPDIQEPKNYGEFLQQKHSYGNPRLSDVANIGMGAVGWGPAWPVGAVLGAVQGRVGDAPEVAEGAANMGLARGAGAVAAKIPVAGWPGALLKAGGTAAALYGGNEAVHAGANAVREQVGKQAGGYAQGGVEAPKPTSLISKAVSTLPGIAPLYEQALKGSSRLIGSENVNKVLDLLGVSPEMRANFFGQAPHVTGAENAAKELAAVSKIPEATTAVQVADATEAMRLAKIDADAAQRVLAAQRKAMTSAGQNLATVSKNAAREGKMAQTYHNDLAISDLKYAYQTRMDETRIAMEAKLSSAPAAQAGAEQIAQVQGPNVMKIRELDQEIAEYDKALLKSSRGAVKDRASGEYGKHEPAKLEYIIDHRAEAMDQKMQLLAEQKAAELGLKGDAMTQLAMRDPEIARMQANMWAMRRERDWQVARAKAGAKPFNPLLDTEDVKAARLQFQQEADAMETLQTTAYDAQQVFVQTQKDLATTNKLFQTARAQHLPKPTEIQQKLSRATEIGPENFVDVLHRNRLAGKEASSIEGDLGENVQDLYKTWVANGDKDAPMTYKKMFVRDFFNAVHQHTNSSSFLDGGSRGAPILAVMSRLGPNPRNVLSNIFRTPGMPAATATEHADAFIKMVGELNDLSLPIAQRKGGVIGVLPLWLFFDMARGAGGLAAGVTGTAAYAVIKTLPVQDLIEKSIENPKLYAEFVEKIHKYGIRGIAEGSKRMRDIFNSMGSVKTVQGNVARAVQVLSATSDKVNSNAEKRYQRTPTSDPKATGYDFTPEALARRDAEEAARKAKKP